MKLKLKNNFKNNYVLYILLAVYIAAGLLTLTRFPFMHSDESWLSGLTRTMMNEGVDATETFFDLFPRYPHAIKILFHLIQMLFISALGYSLFSVRLISLIFGCGVIIVLYKLMEHVTKSRAFSAMAVAAAALDVQFIYASHFARQEIIIVFGLLIIYLHIIKNIENWSYKRDIMTAAIIGLMVGIHPNSFIAALAAGSIYIYYVYVEKKLKLKNLLMLVGVTAAFAALFIGISYIFDAQFITHYLKYGDNLGVTMTFAEKIRAIVPYYQKLWLGISGTYYTPFIKIQMVLFAGAILSGIVYAFFDKKVLLWIFPIAAVNLGYIIIGRYSQPSVLLTFAACWLLVFALIGRIKITNVKLWLTAALAAAMLTVSAVQISPYMNDDYEEYLDNIKSAVPEDAKVLANLNAEYAFAYDALRDYRNLSYLQDNGTDFADYVKSNEIEYIIYPEEMDYIYEKRPVWNIVYGNVYPYYEDMNEFFKDNCELVSEFDSPYAMRIVQFADDEKWSVKVYKVVK